MRVHPFKNAQENYIIPYWKDIAALRIILHHFCDKLFDAACGSHVYFRD